MKTETVSLTVEPARCTFCRACEMACSFTKGVIYAPEHSRIQVIQDYEQGVNIPIVCINCSEAPCIDVCPSEAIYRDRVSQVVAIDEDLCTVCGECVEICPYAAVHIPEGKETAVMCDLCGGEPACVDSCLYGALTFEMKPDTTLSTSPQLPAGESLEDRRWALATKLAEAVRSNGEVKP